MAKILVSLSTFYALILYPTVTVLLEYFIPVNYICLFYNLVAALLLALQLPKETAVMISQYPHLAIPVSGLVCRCDGTFSVFHANNY